MLVEDKLRAQAEDYHSELGSAIDHLLSSGGKRVRPAVALLMGGLLGAHQDRIVTLASAIELLHTATLVHDDLIDGALLRRGNATLNAQWTPAATVLTGDFVFACAAKLAAETDSVTVMHLFAETLAIIVNGEITQLFSSQGLVSRDNYYKRIYAKTASMFELATGAAALLSPVDDRAVETARSFGYEIGMAFQIMDDILDFTGEQTTIGKPVGSDLRQGLITLPALYYIEENPEDPDLILLLDRNRYKAGSMERLIESIRGSEAIRMAHAEAEKYVDRGLSILAELPSGPESQSLEELSNYIVNRPL